MTDRVATLTVILSEDMRTDDAEEIAKAIKQFRYVANVVLGEPQSVPEIIERSRFTRELAMEVIELIVNGKRKTG